MVYIPTKDYTNISLPNKIHKALKEIAKDEDSLYTSVSEIVKEAIRDKIHMLRCQTIVPGKKKK